MTINWLASHSSANELHDGQTQLCYGDILQYFDAIAATVAPYKITQPLALLVDNSLASALTLLYLLQHGYTFVLLPDSSTDAPLFCRWLIKFPTTATTVLDCSINPAWQADAQYIDDGSAKLLMRTSGSTGTPKWVVFSHAKLYSNALNCVARFGLNAADRVALPLSLYHMFGLGAGLLPSLLAGAALDIQKGANLLKFIQRESVFNPTVAFMTPAFANTLLQTRTSSRPYRLTVTAGDRFRADYFARYEAAFGRLVQLYGSTEMGAVAAAHSDLPLSVRQHSAGLPMPDVKLRLKEAAEGVGELWCHRQYGFDGYVDPSGHAVAADCVDGGYRTKDFARISPEGYVELLGRSDHSVKRDGLLVFFSEIEAVIERLDAIARVAVVTDSSDTPRGKRLIACCTLKSGDSDLTESAIRAYCFKTLPRRIVPDEVKIYAALPLLANGKLDRVTLQTMLNQKEVPCQNRT
jgi:acyl-CoA synthetase (AMP-forming)/AMP-acid ligase II